MSKGLVALQFMRKRDMFLPSCASTIEKELKALEIIKDKQVDIRMFIIYDLEYYNKLQKNDYCKLTKIEDDLLSEVLL